MAVPQPVTYIPLKYAAQKYGIPEKTLLDQVKSGSIASGQLPDGELLVAEHDIGSSLHIRREDFAHLRGRKINVRKAIWKYGIAPRTLSRWAEAKYIRILHRGYRLDLDEGDVAYCAAVYEAKYQLYDGQLSGVPIFDQEGNPYRLKYEEIAAQKRAKRRLKQSDRK